MTGYVRQDTSNNIANGSVVDADDLDNEFDALAGAFSTSTGHTHDGTTAEGAPITVVGPAQEYVGGASDFSPKTDSTYNLGTASVRWATGYIDDLVVTGNVDGRDVSVDGTKLDTIETNADVTDTVNVAAAGALMDSELTSIAAIKALDQGVATTDTPTFANALISGRNVSVDGTKLDTVETNADVTDTTNVTAAGALMDSEVTSLSGIKTLTVPDSTTISAFGASFVADTTAADALVTLGLSTTAAELNYLNGVTSAVQTQLGTKAPLASPALTGTPTAPTATAGTDTTQVATTAFVQDALPKYDGTTQATTSGTSITQAIPAGVTEITVCFDNVQTSGFARFQVQIGTASTLQTTGYDTLYVGFNSSATVDITKDSVNDSLGFYPLSGTVTGIVTLVKIAGTTDKWMATSNVATTAVGNSSSIGSGVVTLSGGLDIVGVNTRLGDTFSSGNIHINWRT